MTASSRREQRYGDAVPGSRGGASRVRAAAAARIQGCMRNIHIAGLAYDPDSEEFNAVTGALRMLNRALGEPGDQPATPRNDPPPEER